MKTISMINHIFHVIRGANISKEEEIAWRLWFKENPAMLLPMCRVKENGKWQQRDGKAPEVGNVRNGPG